MRYRGRSLSRTHGTAVWRGAGSIPSVPSSSVDVEECWDVIGNFGADNPFELERTSNLVYTLSGNNDVGSAKMWDYNGYAFVSPAGNHLPAFSGEPSDNDAISMALSRTNINKPYVDLPVALAELREIPELIKDSVRLAKELVEHTSLANKDYRSIGKWVAETQLHNEFGIKPIASDLAKMLDFANRVERRLRELKSLMSHGDGVTRSATVWHKTEEFPPWRTFITSFYSEYNQVDLVWTTERKKWVSIRWKLLADLQMKSDAELRALASRLVFGQYASFAMLYELMPWSWLIDWFSNIGDIVNSQRNELPVQPTSACVMKRTHTALTKVTDVGSTRTNWTLTPSPRTRTHLFRGLYAPAPLPEFRIPFLDPRQLSILSAISVTRNGHRLTG